MKIYALSFLLFLQQVSLGGLFALAVTPFRVLERGFYKSTTAVLVVAALLNLWGKVDLFLKAKPSALGLWPKVELGIFILYCAFMILYLFTLWGEHVRLRARAFSFSLLLGLLSLGAAAFDFHHAALWSVETFLYPIGFVLSSLLLGGATVGMLMGHWYLIDSGQSLDPFWTIFRFFLIILVVHTCFLFLAPAILYLLGNQATHVGLHRLWSEHMVLFSARVLVSQVGPLVICYMIWKTLKIPNTMAATGLFYIALLGVVVGELLGRQLLSLTALPL